jgi:hypothetical protein
MKESTPEVQKGFVLVVLAIVLIILVGFVALGVDTGALYSARTSAQEVADAAALAGAFTYIKDPRNPNPAALATNDALEVALNNTIMGKAIAAGDVTITPDVANRKVTVVVTSAQPTYFARAIWGNTANISATAIAEAAPNSTGSSCVRPWFIPNTLFASTGPCAACGGSEMLVDIANHEITPFAESKIGIQFTLKPQDPHGAIAPGQFYAIDIPNDLNGDDYKNNITTCTNGIIRCNNSYSVLTGNRVGPTKSGVRELIGDPPRFLWDSAGKYLKKADNEYYDISENVIIAPIWDACNLTGFCPDDDFPQGTMVELTVVGFAVIFLEDIVGDDVVARLLNVTACGDDTGTGTGTEEVGGTVFAIPLRLVRVP